MQKNWNWQKSDWPNFVYDKAAIEPFEKRYMEIAGEFRGMLKYISLKEKNQITLYLLSQEALETSSIEGEILDRHSVQSSLQKHLGLKNQKSTYKPQESGIAEMMMDNFKNFSKSLSHSQMHYWNQLIHNEREDLENIGQYRSSTSPMQIVSGPYGHQKIHFEAVPSKNIESEMNDFISWFNHTKKSLPALTRASLAHLYFVSIHPYEDGNGRISRILVEKTLSQYQGVPALANVSRIIWAQRNKYYEALERNNQELEVTDWILYLAKTIIEAQEYVLAKIDLTIKKTNLYDQHKDDLNEREIKVLEKLFETEPNGFEGGLSAENYIAITKTSRATATRDLQKLVKLGILSKTGERRYTRYSLSL